MKYRILRKEWGGMVIHYPQYRRAFWPFWSKWVDETTTKEPCGPYSVRFGQLANAIKFLDNKLIDERLKQERKKNKAEREKSIKIAYPVSLDVQTKFIKQDSA